MFNTETIDRLGPASLREFMYMMCGECLGQGMTRTTYRCAMDATKVIKVENSISHFQNVREWHIWQDNSECKDVAKWLAPCRYISQNGNFLIMDYAEDIRKAELPALIPSFFTDVKRANLGMINGKIVLRDYGTIPLNMPHRLKKNTWGSV